MEGRKRGGEDEVVLVLRGRDGASGVVEVLQQRAPLLLGNVHLILEILMRETDKH